MKYDQLIKDVVISGADDWVTLGEITCQLGPGLTDDEILHATLEIVREVLDRGWMDVGDTSLEFVPRGWSTHQALTWIEQEWHRLRSEAERAYMCWFANTPAGASGPTIDIFPPRGAGPKSMAALGHVNPLDRVVH